VCVTGGVMKKILTIIFLSISSIVFANQDCYVPAQITAFCSYLGTKTVFESCVTSESSKEETIDCVENNLPLHIEITNACVRQQNRLYGEISNYARIFSTSDKALWEEVSIYCGKRSFNPLFIDMRKLKLCIEDEYIGKKRGMAKKETNEVRPEG
jgi:hypothetical protein